MPRKYTKRTDTATRELAKGAYKGVKYLKSIVNSESHYFDLTNSAAIANTGTIVHLTAMAQGNDQSDRTGNSVLLSSIQGKAIMRSNTGATTGTFLREILFQDMQQISDTSPSVSDILDVVSVNGYINKATVGRFKILHDKMMVMNASDKVNKYVPFFKKYNHHVRWNGPTGTDIQKGGIYVLWISDQPTNTPVVGYSYRIKYHDN